MRDFLALMFFKGALMKNPDGVPEVQGPNSRAGYRLRRQASRKSQTRSARIEKHRVRILADKGLSDR